MAKKKQRSGSTVAFAELEPRVRKALNEGRTQNALELAKQLYKYEPTPGHKELLRHAYRARAQQLHSQGYDRDAATVLETALPLGDDAPEWLAQVVVELARYGGTCKAREAAASLPDPAVQASILHHSVDAAIADGAAGRQRLAVEHQPTFDLVLQAFKHAEAGQDEAAREALQGIGLQSPFLDWKMLVRGLLSYYQGDDTRALENWQRLKPDRLPARLAAPLRFPIDPDYRASQSPATQAILHRRADRLQGSLMQPMRVLQAALAHPERLSEALRLAGGVVQLLRQQMPELLPRLASCFYWAVVSFGEPQDLARYQRNFGAPADDPSLDRMRALLLEHRDESEEAHMAWQRFEQQVASQPALWGNGSADPVPLANRVRALLWLRMGDNAACDEEEFDEPLRPDAVSCYENSLKLAPDLLGAYMGLMNCYLHQQNLEQANKVGRRLLEHHPEHGQTMVVLGGVAREQKRYEESLEWFQRALRSNPLDRSLRKLVAGAKGYLARAQVEAGRFAEARASYEEALTFCDNGQDRQSLLCKSSACEFKSGAAERGEELLRQACTVLECPAAVAYLMATEAARMKLPTSLKSRFDKEFAASLTEEPTAAAAAYLANYAGSLRTAEHSYRGQKAHEKKILGYLKKSSKLDFTEAQLVGLCSGLLDLKELSLLKTFASLGKKRFPQNPFFYFYEADYYFSLGPDRCPVAKMLHLVKKAADLAQGLPQGNEKEVLLAKIQHIQNTVDSGPLDMLSHMFGGMPDDFFDDEPSPFGGKRRKPR